MDNSIIEFKAIIDKLVKDFGNFKIYAVTPISEKENLKFNKYGNVSISGDIQELTLGMEYTIKGQENKYGYEVLNIKREKPNTINKTIDFLTEVITETQAKTLLSVYPDIVNKIINNELNDVDLSKTKGIKEKKFEVIKNKIIENFPLIDFIDEFKEYGISLKMARKMYKSFPSIERMKEKMLKDPYETLCSISGIGFKKADSMILNVDKNKKLINSIERMKACVKFCLTENENNGNTWISLGDLLTQCNELIPESIDYLIDVLQDKNIYVDGENRRIAYKYTYETEKYIAKTLINMMKNNKKLLIDLDKYTHVDGFPLTEEQRNMLVNFCKYNISMLAGGGGMGKSFSISSLINLMEDNNITYKLCTPTGASSEVLSNYSGKESSTIHRLLGFKNGEFTFNKNNKLNIDALICDESSMIDIFLMKHLLEAIDINRTKILFVQDEEQISSVGAGRCSYDLLHCDFIPKTLLTKVFRYKDGGLAKVISDVRNGISYTKDDFDVIKTFGNDDDYALIKIPKNDIVMTVCNIYKRLLDEGENIKDIVVITSMNKGDWGTIIINNEIQEAINPHSNDKPYIKNGDVIFREGDKVIQTKNNYQATNFDFGEDQIWNGNQGIITNVYFNEIIVKFNNNKIIRYALEDINDLSLAYAISIHKMQGNASKNVIFISPPAHFYMLNKNLFYTALSRAKKKVFHITEDLKIINSALKKSENAKRNTFLGFLLKEVFNEI